MPIDNDRLRRLAGLPPDDDEISQEEIDDNARYNREYNVKQYILQVVEACNLGDDVEANAFYDEKTNVGEIVLTHVDGVSLAAIAQLLKSPLANDFHLSVSSGKLNISFELKK